MQIYATRDDSMPMIEGDPVQCIRGIWAHLTPEQKAQVRAELFPKRGSLGHALQVAQVEARREELGILPLKVFDPEASPPEEDGPDFHDGKPLAPIFDVPPEHEPSFVTPSGEVVGLDEAFALATDGQDGDE